MALLENILLQVGHSWRPVAKWAFCRWIFMEDLVVKCSEQIGHGCFTITYKYVNKLE